MNLSYKIKIAYIIISMITSFCFSQQDAHFTQYMYNTISINPAYAGSREMFSVIGLHRSQWVGLDGAPRTQTFSLNTPIDSEHHLGLGFSLVNDAIGPSRESTIDLDISYAIDFKELGRLRFGIKAGLHILDVDFDRLEFESENDIVFFSGNIDNRISPNVGFGVYYNTEQFYFGVSTLNLLQTKHFDESAFGSDSQAVSFLAKERINSYISAGYVLEVFPEIKFKPALLSKIVFGSPLQIDLSANFLFQEKFTLGASYRLDASVSGLVAFQLSNSMMIGFGYDRETTRLGKTRFNSGSYELMLRFEISSSKLFDRYLAPRFF